MDYIPPQCYLSSNNNPPEVTKTPTLQDTTPSLPSSRSFSPGKNGNNNGNSSRGSNRSSKMRDSPRNVHRSNSSSSSRRTNTSDKIPPATLLALAACGENTLDSHVAPTLDGYRGDTCGSFEYQRAKHRKRGNGSLDGKEKKDKEGETTSSSAKSSKKDGSSQTDLKIPVSTPGSDKPPPGADFERQIRRLLDEQSLLREPQEPGLVTARYVPAQFVPVAPLVSPNLASISELAKWQEQSLGLDDSPTLKPRIVPHSPFCRR